VDAVTDDISDRRGTAPRADLLSCKAAYQLAEEIYSFWKSRGAEITVKVLELRTAAAPHPVYVIRSDLVNGLPRGWTAARLKGSGDV
jgi:hypothetical protein